MATSRPARGWQGRQVSRAGGGRTAPLLIQRWLSPWQYREASPARQRRPGPPGGEDFFSVRSAAEADRQATQPAADRSDARYLQGLCLAGQEKPSEAAAVFQAILADDPQYAGADKALFELAWSYKALGQETEAADAFLRKLQHQARRSRDR